MEARLRHETARWAELYLGEPTAASGRDTRLIRVWDLADTDTLEAYLKNCRSLRERRAAAKMRTLQKRAHFVDVARD